MKFASHRYPQLLVHLEDGRCERFADGQLETDDPDWIEALEGLAERDPDVAVLPSGKTPSRKELNAIALELGVTEPEKLPNIAAVEAAIAAKKAEQA